MSTNAVRYFDTTRPVSAARTTQPVPMAYRPDGELRGIAIGAVGGLLVGFALCALMVAAVLS